MVLLRLLSRSVRPFPHRHCGIPALESVQPHVTSFDMHGIEIDRCQLSHTARSAPPLRPAASLSPSPSLSSHTAQVSVCWKQYAAHRPFPASHLRCASDHTVTVESSFSRLTERTQSLTQPPTPLCAPIQQPAFVGTDKHANPHRYVAEPTPRRRQCAHAQSTYPVGGGDCDDDSSTDELNRLRCLVSLPILHAYAICAALAPLPTTYRTG